MKASKEANMGETRLTTNVTSPTSTDSPVIRPAVRCTQIAAVSCFLLAKPQIVVPSCQRGCPSDT